ncbi:hypothetical protein BGZ46_004833, partial [Entomortierella lignicola]
MNISAPTFFKDLNYTDRMTAHRDFTSAIAHSMFSDNQTRTLKAAFNTWKSNEADKFWSGVTKSNAADLSLDSTETSLIQNAVPLANKTLRQSAERKLDID